MASGDARAVPIKAQAYRLQFGIFKNDGTLITGATGLDSEISKDGGAFADCTNEATEIGSTGIYTLDLTTTETTATSVIVNTKSTSTGAVPVVNVLNLVTDAREVGFVPQVIPDQNITLNSSTEKVLFMVYDLWGRPATGLTFSAAEIQISKQGAAAANSGGVDAEVDATDFPGLYSYTVTVSESDTEGVCTLNVAKTGYISAVQPFNVAESLDFVGGLQSVHVATLATSISGLLNRWRRNTQLVFPFMMVDSTDLITPEPGKTVTAAYSHDGGSTYSTCTNAVTETADGRYKITLAAADMNADAVTIRLTATGCRTLYYDFNMQPE